MSEKDFVKEQFSLLKIGVTAILGTAFTIAVYNIQTSGSNFIPVILSIIVLIIVLFGLAIVYKKKLDELKAMP